MADTAKREAVVVTGATGFIGRHACRHLASAGFEARGLVRAMPKHLSENIRCFATGNVEEVPDNVLDEVMQGASAVVHLAGRAHVLEDHATDRDATYALANVEVTARLVSAAIRNHVHRFVFASTVKVNGEFTAPGRPFRPADVPAPQDAYARSKAEAERVVLAAAEGSPMLPIVLRLPLVYGPGVRGNFARLLDAIASEQRLPIGAIDNRRSIVSVTNVCSAIEAVLVASSRVRGVHFVADDEAVSTPQLVRAIGEALGTPAHIVHVPLPLLRFAAWITRHGAELQRLVSSLEVDSASLRASAQWRPRHTLQAGLADTAAWWRVHHSI